MRQPQDEWTKRLMYLEEHGTASLNQGEAFMFAEDTGEATLFLADGGTIRRKIANPRDTKEVVRERRPDILIPEDLMYNLSLLGKLMPKFDESQNQQASQRNQNQSGRATAIDEFRLQQNNEWIGWAMGLVQAHL